MQRINKPICIIARVVKRKRCPCCSGNIEKFHDGHGAMVSGSYCNTFCVHDGAQIMRMNISISKRNDCGLVVEEKMVDTSQELQGSFESGEKKGRGGAPLSMQKFDKGLTTNVGEVSDIYKLDAGSTRKFLRLKKWQERVSTSIERNLRLAMTELGRVASFLNLQKVDKDESSRIYQFVLQRG